MSKFAITLALFVVDVRVQQCCLLLTFASALTSTHLLLAADIGAQHAVALISRAVAFCSRPAQVLFFARNPRLSQSALVQNSRFSHSDSIALYTLSARCFVT